MLYSRNGERKIDLRCGCGALKRVFAKFCRPRRHPQKLSPVPFFVFPHLSDDTRTHLQIIVRYHPVLPILHSLAKNRSGKISHSEPTRHDGQVDGGAIAELALSKGFVPVPGEGFKKGLAPEVRVSGPGHGKSGSVVLVGRGIAPEGKRFPGQPGFEPGFQGDSSAPVSVAFRKRLEEEIRILAVSFKISLFQFSFMNRTDAYYLS